MVSLGRTRTCRRVLVGWKNVLMPNGARILLMDIRDGYIGIWWGGVLARGRAVIVLLLYQPPGVAILLQSTGNPSFLFSSGSGC